MQPVASRPCLRALREADEAVYCALYGCAGSMRHVGRPLDAAVARGGLVAALRQMRAVPVRARYWMIVDPRLDAAVGLVGMVLDGPAAGSAEIGVLLAEGHGNRGYASGAILAVCGRAFGDWGIGQLWTRHAVGHVAAERLMRKVGFARMTAPEGGAPEQRWRRALGAPLAAAADAGFDFADGHGDH